MLNGELAPFRPAALLRRAMMRKKDISVLGAHVKNEGLAYETAALYAEQGGARQVYLRGQPFRIEGEIADRGEVIEVDIFLSGFRDHPLGALKLLVLHFELDLVDLQLMDEPFRIDRTHLR